MFSDVGNNFSMIAALKKYDPGQMSIHWQVGSLEGWGTLRGKTRPGGSLNWGKELGNYETVIMQQKPFTVTNTQSCWSCGAASPPAPAPGDQVSPPVIKAKVLRFGCRQIMLEA